MAGLVWLSGLNTDLRTKRSAGSIPRQGMYVPGLQAGPHLGACERQPIDVSHIDVSLLPFLLLFPFSLKINK